MKKLLICALLTFGTVAAYADTSVRTTQIDMFSITTSNKLILQDKFGTAYVAPLSKCSISSVVEMEKPNIFFVRNVVKPQSTVVVYDKKNRKNSVRCNINKLEEYDKLTLHMAKL